MHNKKDFYRLLSVKREIDRYLESMVWYWEKKQTGEGKWHRGIDVVGYPKDGFITLRLDGGKEMTIPLSNFHEKDDTEHAYMLWHSDYYDGPISGMAEYKGKKVWFKWDKDVFEPLTDMRIFNLYELSDAEIEDEEQWHQYFREMVGHHCDYVEGKKGRVKYTPKSFDKFYAEGEKRKPRDYANNKLVVTLDETFIDRGYPKKDVDND